MAPLAALSVQITLSPYDPAWPKQFARHANRIEQALGPRALAIAHVGSTSVPGLAAKAVIDVVLTVADAALEARYAPQLTSAGYELVLSEPEWFEHRLFVALDPPANVHVFSADCPEIARMAAFRDRLRANPADLELYAEAKRRLAEQPWPSIDAYAQAKTDIVAEILRRAQGQS